MGLGAWKGEIREDFLISVLEECAESKPCLVRGTLSDGQRDAGQLDIILCRPHSQLRKLGQKCFVAKSDSLCVIEVKGNCTGRDLTRAEAKAKKIQKLKGDHGPLYGVVCYKSELNEKTIMKRFGYSFDKITATYLDPATNPNVKKSEWQKLEYPHLDFFVSFEEDKKMFLRKYAIRDGPHRFTRSNSVPVIKDLFSLVQSLWKTAHRE